MYWEIIALLSFTSVPLRGVLAEEKHIEEDSLLYWRRSNEQKCEPFTKFNEKCNKCICGADGTTYCTRMFCMRRSRSVKEDEYYNY